MRPADPSKILLVDDDPVARRLAALLLQRLGHAPAKTMANGDEALQAVLSGDYDLVLIDPAIPGQDGRAALRAIVETPGVRRPRIVIMTAAEDGQAQCLAAGADDHLAKPLGLRPLAEALALVRPTAVSDDFNAATWAELLRVFKPRGAAELVAAAAANLADEQRRHAAAVEAGDLAALGRLVHALRGACLQFGAEGPAALCAQAERACVASDQALALSASTAALARYALLLQRLEREARAD